MVLYILDDDQLELELWCATLRKYRPEWEIFLFHCANKMMEQFSQIVPDAVVTDFVMPFVTGIKVCQWVHQNYPEVKMYISTGLDGEEFKILAEACSAVYISKQMKFHDRVGVIADAC